MENFLLCLAVGFLVFLVVVGQAMKRAGKFISNNAESISDGAKTAANWNVPVGNGLTAPLGAVVVAGIVKSILGKR